MRLIKHPKIGEYVLASRWRSADPNDPWHVGFVESITQYENGYTYKLKDSQRQWKHVRRLTQEEGQDWLYRYLEDEQ